MDASEAFDDPQIIALADAAARGDRAQVRELVTQGADVDTRGDRGVNLLEWAMLSKSPEGLEALLEAGADPAAPGMGDSTAIHTAAIANDPVYLEILLTHGADPNTQEPESGEPVLSTATGAGNESQFRMLLAAGADPNRADRMGDTPLHRAARTGPYWEVLALLEAGADPLARNAQDAAFHDYLHVTPEQILNERAKADLAAIDAWLREHDIPVEHETESQ